MNKNPKSRIYIAGHTGMVGSAILRRLESDGFTNLIVRKRSELDLTSQAAVRDFFAKEKPEYIFLCAAKVGGILANKTYPADFIYDNLMISMNVIDASYRNGVKKLINLGSSCIYPKEAPQPLKEEYLLSSELEPTNEAYAIAKIAAIKMCSYYNHQYGTNYVSLMPTNLYGPNDNYNLVSSHVLPALIRKSHLAKLLLNDQYDQIVADLSRNGADSDLSGLTVQNIDKINSYLLSQGIEKSGDTVKLHLWGTGAPYREFLHVDDVADASIFIMQKYDASHLGELVNVGTGRDLTIKNLAQLVQDIVGFDGEVSWDKTKPDGTPRKLLDISKISKLGWQPKVCLDDGIRAVYEAYKGKG